MSDVIITDEEILYRRIPPGNSWFEPPDRISSANFKLRHGEEGLSVYRAKIVSTTEVLNKPEAVPGSLIVQATAEQIRSAKNGKGESIGLDVIPINDDNDPGHAEIRGYLTSSTAKSLQRLFTLVSSTS